MFSLVTVNPESLIPFNRQLLTPLPSGLLTIEKYRAVMAPDKWCLLTESLKTTRSYPTGFDAAALLFRATVGFHDELTERERDRAYHIIAIFILEMLDKLDRWEDYLSWFGFLRDYCKLHLRQHHLFINKESEIELYKIGVDGDYILVKYMYHYHPRMRLIERKLKRMKAGKSIAHLRHHPKEELSREEISRRLNQVLAFWEFKQDARKYWNEYWERKAGRTQEPE